MSAVLEFLLDIAVELVLELYMYLASAFFPSAAKNVRRGKLIKGIAAVTAVVFLALLVLGIALIIDHAGKTLWGWLCAALGAVFLLSSVVLKIVKK